MVQPARLDAAARTAALARAASGPVDVLVVGGGVVGCGVALDAAARGLSVALVERDDLGAGASSRSSKLVHGGVRYLEQLDLRLVREALRERAVLLTHVAPHLVRPTRFLYPVARGRRHQELYVAAGLSLYDTLGGRNRLLPRHRRLSRTEALELAPGLHPALGGALEYWDATVDDARLTVALARTAAGLGAVVAPGVEVVGFLREGERVTGVRARDRESGEELELRARHVVCAAGAESGDVLRLATPRQPLRMAPSKGAHVLVPRARFDSRAAIITRTAESVLFVVPWGEHWILGTTDTPWASPREQPVATRDDMRYLLGQANRVVADPLSPDDVVAGYAGLRPLIAGGAARRTARLSREHAVVQPVAGLTLVAGGKLTTYRLMARDAVDAAAGQLPGRVAPSATERLPLVGAAGTVSGDHGLAPAQLERLLGRYGSELPEVLAPAAADPGLREPIPGAPGYLRAEALFAVTHEGARRLEDVLLRRTHAGIETSDRGLAASEPVAAQLGAALGWDDARVREEVERYRALVAAEAWSGPAATAAR